MSTPKTRRAGKGSGDTKRKQPKVIDTKMAKEDDVHETPGGSGGDENEGDEGEDEGSESEEIYYEFGQAYPAANPPAKEDLAFFFGDRTQMGKMSKKYPDKPAHSRRLDLQVDDKCNIIMPSSTSAGDGYETVATGVVHDVVHIQRDVDGPADLGTKLLTRGSDLSNQIKKDEESPLYKNNPARITHYYSVRDLNFSEHTSVDSHLMFSPSLYFINIPPPHISECAKQKGWQKHPLGKGCVYAGDGTVCVRVCARLWVTYMYMRRAFCV